MDSRASPVARWRVAKSAGSEGLQIRPGRRCALGVAQFGEDSHSLGTVRAGSVGLAQRALGAAEGGQCPWRASLAESFNAAVKVERVHRTVYPTRKKARDDIARYIELRYNRMRLHSALGYRTPQEVHDEYLNGQVAA